MGHKLQDSQDEIVQVCRLRYLDHQVEWQEGEEVVLGCEHLIRVELRDGG